MIPKQLQKEVFRFILVKKMEKIPIEKDWQNTSNYLYNDPRLIEHISTGNYGVATGYGNLIVIDFDDKKLQEKTIPNLPTTFTTMSGGGLLHKWFIVDDPQTIKIMDSNKNTLADIQGKGKQVIGPGSTHPNGNKYVVFDDSEIATINISEIKALFSDYILPKRDKLRTFQTSEVVKEIKSKINIPELLGLFRVNTNKNPTDCPMHSSKGGKCLSYKDDLWYCFHCEKGGDVFNLVMEKEGIDFLNAKNWFIDKYKIDVKETRPTLKITNYLENVNEFYKFQPFFYDKAGIFWFWNRTDKKWEMVDDVDVMNSIDDELEFGGETVTSGIKSNYLESFKRVGRKHKPKEAPTRWIQFKDKAFSLRSKNIYKVTPDYFFTNPIPWDIGETADTPTIDKLFSEWVGKKRLKDLYEFIAYCCYRDYPIQVLFCIFGHGRNGKTSFINIIDKFLGEHNTCTTDLDLIAGKNKSRFETIRLYKKLACFMGETNFSILENSSILKRLVGGDKIGYEVKRAGLFDDKNYAKIIIASNSLPSSEDTSEGFYRRWHIIEFNNEFPEGKDVSLTIPEGEFNNLAKKVIEILPSLLERGKFSNMGSIEDRKMRYVMASNPLPYFIQQFCYLNPDGYIRYSKFYHFYTQYLKRIKRRIIGKKEFSRVLINEGLENRRTSKDGEVDYYVEGVQFKKNEQNLPDLPDFQELSFNSMSIGLNYDFRKSGKSSKKCSQNEQKGSQNEKTVPDDILIELIEDAKEGKI